MPYHNKSCVKVQKDLSGPDMDIILFLWFVREPVDCMTITCMSAINAN